jgi:hypothetical protein
MAGFLLVYMAGAFGVPTPILYVVVPAGAARVFGHTALLT